MANLGCFFFSFSVQQKQLGKYQSKTFFKDKTLVNMIYFQIRLNEPQYGDNSRSVRKRQRENTATQKLYKLKSTFQFFQIHCQFYFSDGYKY